MLKAQLMFVSGVGRWTELFVGLGLKKIQIKNIFVLFALYGKSFFFAYTVKVNHLNCIHHIFVYSAYLLF